MNVLILSESEALSLIAKQSGQHRLAPVRLTDGSYFLSADVLTETQGGIYAGQLDGVLYAEVPFADIQHLIEVHDEI
jgi:hypothetical protein